MNKINKLLTFLLLLTITIPVFAVTNTVDCGVFADITRPAAKIIMIAAPILLLVMGTIDLTRAVAASDDKAMKKVFSDLLKRFVICLIILILPVIINMLMGWIKFNDLNACW